MSKCCRLIGRGLYYHWYNILSPLSGGIITIVQCTEWYDNWDTFITILCVCIGIVSPFLYFILVEAPRVEQQAEYEKHRAWTDELKDNIPDLFKMLLYKWSASLECIAKDRISLYIILEDQFALCARLSQNPEFEKSGRGSYPKDAGVIGKAWTERVHYDADIPTDPEHFGLHLKNMYGIPLGVSKKLKMRSASCYGFRIDDHNHSKPVGIIIVESTEKHRFDESELTAILEADRILLHALITTFRDFIPAIARIKQSQEF